MRYEVLLDSLDFEVTDEDNDGNIVVTVWRDALSDEAAEVLAKRICNMLNKSHEAALAALESDPDAWKGGGE